MDIDSLPRTNTIADHLKWLRSLKPSDNLVMSYALVQCIIEQLRVSMPVNMPEEALPHGKAQLHASGRTAAQDRYDALRMALFEKTKPEPIIAAWTCYSTGATNGKIFRWGNKTKDEQERNRVCAMQMKDSYIATSELIPVYDEPLDKPTRF